MPAQSDQNTPMTLSQLFARLFAENRAHVTICLSCIVAASVISTVPALAIKSLVDSGLQDHNVTVVTWSAAAMILATLVSISLGLLQTLLSSQLSETAMFRLRMDMIRKLHTVPLTFFDRSRTGDIVNRVGVDVGMLSGMLSTSYTTAISTVISFAVAATALVALDWRLSIGVLVFVAFSALPLRRSGSMFFKIQKSQRSAADSLNSRLQESFSPAGALLNKSLARETDEALLLEAFSAQIRDLDIGMIKVGLRFNSFVSASTTLGPALVWLVGGVLALKGQVSVGTLIAFTALLPRLLAPASAWYALYAQLSQGRAIFSRVAEYLALSPSYAPPPLCSNASQVAGNVAYERVRFSYDQGSDILCDVTFTVDAGEVVAFVGKSGAGKSTLLRLLLRLYRPLAGSIKIDGVDIQSFAVNELRRIVGAVTQDPFFFNVSIRENLLYGDPNATQEVIVKACENANLSDFIAQLPNGLHTVVGEGGYSLSGGQRQRLAIARIILRDPQILLLDEATSALDSESEALVRGALTNLMRQRTTLVVAHRLSTVVRANRICVLDDGKIVDSGTHESLMARSGLYRRLFSEQVFE